MYIFSYFKTDDEAMCLAYSAGGCDWREMGGRSALRSCGGQASSASRLQARQRLEGERGFWD